MIMAMAITVSTVFGMNLKTASAADYTSASDMAFTGAWSEDKWITEESGDHWYRLVIPSDGEVEFRMMSYIDELSYDLYTEDLSERLYHIYTYGGNETQPKTTVSNYALSSGTYYMKVYGYNGKYKINASFTSYGTNDISAISYDSPQSYSLSNQITGAITVTDSEDWYCMVVSNTGYYSVNIQIYKDDTDISIYNNDLSERKYYKYMYGGTVTAPKTSNENVVLEAGTYYIKVAGDPGRYIFNVSALNQSNCSHDYKTQYVDATYTSKGYQIHKCELCGHSYMDNYKDKLQLGQVETVYCSVGKGKCNLSWYSISNSNGYQIRYSTNKSMKKSVKTVKVKGKTSKIIKKLKHRKKYYFQVRAYKKEGNQTAYGKWSKKAKTRIK